MNITKLTQDYISKHPSIRDCVKKGLINYSALSREICRFYGIDNFNAALAASRRYCAKAKTEAIHEEKIIALLRGVKLHVRNKIIVAIVEKLRNMDKFYMFKNIVKKQKGEINLIEGEDVITIITNPKFKREIKKRFKHNLLKLNENLVQLTLVFDTSIETTSGVVAYVYSLLAQQGINIVEEMSCWTDILIVIDENDMPAAVKILSF